MGYALRFLRAPRGVGIAAGKSFKIVAATEARRLCSVGVVGALGGAEGWFGWPLAVEQRGPADCMAWGLRARRHQWGP